MHFYTLELSFAKFGCCRPSRARVYTPLLISRLKHRSFPGRVIFPFSRHLWTTAFSSLLPSFASPSIPFRQSYIIFIPTSYPFLPFLSAFSFFRRPFYVSHLSLRPFEECESSECSERCILCFDLLLPSSSNQIRSCGF